MEELFHNFFMSTMFCSCEKEVHIPSYLVQFHQYVIPTLLQNITALTVQFGDKEKQGKNDLFWLPNLRQFLKSTFCRSKAKTGPSV